MIMSGTNPIGSIGIRWQKNQWEIYNVILGDKKFSKKGIMGMGLKRVIQFALDRRPGKVALKVLRSNPAVTWYENNGFSIANTSEEYLEMSFTAKSEAKGKK